MPESNFMPKKGIGSIEGWERLPEGIKKELGIEEAHQKEKGLTSGLAKKIVAIDKKIFTRLTKIADLENFADTGSKTTLDNLSDLVKKRIEMAKESDDQELIDESVEIDTAMISATGVYQKETASSEIGPLKARDNFNVAIGLIKQRIETASARLTDEKIKVKGTSAVDAVSLRPKNQSEGGETRSNPEKPTRRERKGKLVPKFKGGEGEKKSESNPGKEGKKPETKSGKTSKEKGVEAVEIKTPFDYVSTLEELYIILGSVREVNYGNEFVASNWAISQIKRTVNEAKEITDTRERFSFLIRFISKFKDRALRRAMNRVLIDSDPALREEQSKENKENEEEIIERHLNNLKSMAENKKTTYVDDTLSEAFHRQGEYPDYLKKLAAAYLKAGYLKEIKAEEKPEDPKKEKALKKPKDQKSEPQPKEPEGGEERSTGRLRSQMEIVQENTGEKVVSEEIEKGPAVPQAGKPKEPAEKIPPPKKIRRRKGLEVPPPLPGEELTISQMLNQGDFPLFLAQFPDSEVEVMMQYEETEKVRAVYEAYTRKELVIRALEKNVRGQYEQAIGVKFTTEELNGINDFIQTEAIQNPERTKELADLLEQLEKTEKENRELERDIAKLAKEGGEEVLALKIKDLQKTKSELEGSKNKKNFTGTEWKTFVRRFVVDAFQKEFDERESYDKALEGVEENIKKAEQGLTQLKEFKALNERTTQIIKDVRQGLLASVPILSEIARLADKKAQEQLEAMMNPQKDSEKAQEYFERIKRFQDESGTHMFKGLSDDQIQTDLDVLIEARVANDIQKIVEEFSFGSSKNIDRLKGALKKHLVDRKQLGSRKGEDSKEVVKNMLVDVGKNLKGPDAKAKMMLVTSIVRDLEKKP